MNTTERKPSFFNKLLQALLAVGGTSTLSQVLVMLQSLILARWIGPEQNAYVLAAFNVAGLGFILVNWGFDHWLIQRTSLEFKENLHDLAKVLSIKLALGTAISAILLVMLPVVNGRIYLPIILAISLLDVLVDSLCASCYAYLLAIDRYKLSSLIVTIARILRLAGTLVLILFKVNSLTLFLALRLFLGLMILIYMLVIIKPRISIVHLNQGKNLFRISFAFGIAEILNIIYNRADLTVLAFLSITKSEISYYGITTNILFACTAILQTLQNVLVPIIIQQKKTEPSDKPLEAIGNHQKATYLQPLLLLLFIGLIGMTFLYFLAQPIINLVLGTAYTPAGPLLRLGSPLILLSAINVAFSSFLIACQRQELKLFPLITVTVLKIGLILIFFSKYGMRGTIVIFIICELLLAVLYALQFWRINKQPLRTASLPEEK